MSQLLNQYKLYVINLDRRHDRWIQTEQALQEKGFTNYERFSAIDGKLIDTEQMKTLVDPKVYKDLGKIRKRDEDLGSVGAVGCYLSHYKLWQQIAQTGIPAIIVEDDIEFHKNWESFSIVYDTTPLENYDVVFLGHGYLRESKLIPKIKNNGIYPYRGMFFGLQFYYITPKAARLFLEDSLPMFYQVDSHMSYKIKDDSTFRVGAHFPSIVNQSGSTTDIQTPKYTNAIFIYIINTVQKTFSCPKNTFYFCALVILLILLYKVWLVKSTL